MILLSIYIFYAAPKVLRIVQKNKEVKKNNDKKKSKVQFQTKMLYVSGFITIPMSLCIIGYIFFPQIRGDAYIYNIGLYIWFILSMLIDFFHVIIFYAA